MMLVDWPKPTRAYLLCNLGSLLQFADAHHFYLALDTNFVLNVLEAEVEYLGRYWGATQIGRPLLIANISKQLIGTLGCAASSVHAILIVLTR
jgi:hypothetical protein